MVKDVAGAVIQATANGGKVIQDVQTLEYPATQVRWWWIGWCTWIWFGGFLVRYGMGFVLDVGSDLVGWLVWT